MAIRAAAVAGTWYPGSAGALTREVDAYLAAATEGPAGSVHGDRRAACRAHVFRTGGAYAYKAAASGEFDVAVLVGPSHFAAFEGAALWPDGAFEWPLGLLDIDRRGGARACRIADGQALCPRRTGANIRSRCSCRFCSACFPDLPIVPVLIGLSATRDDRSACDRARRSVRGSAGAARREHRSVPLFRRRDRGVTRRASAGARPRFDPEGLLDFVRGISGRRARPVRRLRRRGGDSGDDGGAHARRDRRARPEVRAFRGSLGRQRRRRRLPGGGVREVRRVAISCVSCQLSAISFSYQLTDNITESPATSSTPAVAKLRVASNQSPVRVSQLRHRP